MTSYDDPIVESVSDIPVAEILDVLAKAQLRVQTTTAKLVDSHRYQRLLLAPGQRAPHRLDTLEDVVGRPWQFHDPYFKGQVPVSVDDLDHRVFLDRDAELDGRYLRGLFHLRQRRELSPEGRLDVGGQVIADLQRAGDVDTDTPLWRVLHAEFLGIVEAEQRIGFRVLDRRAYAIRAAYRGLKRATEMELDPMLDQSNLPRLMSTLRGSVQ